jgi:hypothetical protein
MHIHTIHTHNIQIAEVMAETLVISDKDSGTDLVGNLYYQGFDRVLLYEKNIAPAFFDLKTGIAGEVLQKFSNYRVRLAVIGDFTAYKSKSLQDFIRESNAGEQVLFLQSKEEALRRLSV